MMNQLFAVALSIFTVSTGFAQLSPIPPYGMSCRNPTYEVWVWPSSSSKHLKFEIFRKSGNLLRQAGVLPLTSIQGSTLTFSKSKIKIAVIIPDPVKINIASIHFSHPLLGNSWMSFKECDIQ